MPWVFHEHGRRSGHEQGSLPACSLPDAQEYARALEIPLKTPALPAFPFNLFGLPPAGRAVTHHLEPLEK